MTQHKLHPNLQDLYTSADFHAVHVNTEQCPTYDTGLSPVTICAPSQVHNGFAEGDNTIVYTLSYYYALKVFEALMVEIQAGKKNIPFPAWCLRDESFRQLKYQHEGEDASSEQLVMAELELLANSGEITVREEHFLRAGDPTAWEERMARMALEFTSLKYDVYVVDSESVNEAFDKIEKLDGQFTPGPERTYGWNDIKGYFRPISLAERELMHSWILHQHTPLDLELMDACDKLDVELVGQLIEKGANVNALNSIGMTALALTVDFLYDRFDSSFYGDDVEELSREEIHQRAKAIIDILVAHGADLNLFGFTGNTPLGAAQDAEADEIVDYLLAAGADPNVSAEVFALNEDEDEDW